MRFLATFLVSVVLLAGQAAKLTVPQGAVATAPGTFRYTDTAGKQWIYHTSPFGVSREAAGAPSRFVRDFANVKATEEGDTVRFERPTPFGPFRWQTKKSDLNEMERTVWQREQDARSAAARQE
jgi:hypothetical protein